MKPASVRRWERPRRADILLGVLVAVLVMGVVMTAAAVLIVREFEPQGSLLGLPARIPTCGREYRDNPSSRSTWTRAEVEMQAAPGHVPVIFEPVIGQIPLLAPFAGGQSAGGAQGCDTTLVYLRVGPDAYRSYALQGGG